MSQDVGGLSAWKVCFGAGVLALHAMSAHAQPAGAADGAPSEAARRQALSPFRMILQSADAPRRAVPAPKRAAPEPSPAPAVVGAPAPSLAPVAVTAPPPAPAPVQAAVAPSPAPSEPPKAEQVSVAKPSAPPAPKAPEPPPPIELVPIQQDAPILSAALRREQPQGKVMVAFSVKPDGTTGDVQVVQTSDRRLNSASVHAVSNWRFKPIREAQPVEVELVYGDDDQ
ncbi:TonB family protein [Ramlibacter algicola]|uniref:TonB family protein n=1 Tax=Ramlibacter algicola TaxID=2795217 RepID=A0A934URX1_9BURK|nr:TonB family protein [Ramlibacter algicola]MBK0392962.1 TonB family protein [Ramlibacter algicola]